MVTDLDRYVREFRPKLRILRVATGLYYYQGSSLMPEYIPFLVGCVKEVALHVAIERYLLYLSESRREVEAIHRRYAAAAERRR